MKTNDAVRINHPTLTTAHRFGPIFNDLAGASPLGARLVLGQCRHCKVRESSLDDGVRKGLNVFESLVGIDDKLNIRP